MNLEVENNCIELYPIKFDLKENTITDTQKNITFLFSNLKDYIQLKSKDNFSELAESIKKICITLAFSEENIDLSISVAKSSLAFKATIQELQVSYDKEIQEKEKNLIIRSILKVCLKRNDFSNLSKLLNVIDNKLIKDSSYTLIIQYLSKEKSKNTLIKFYLKEITHFTFYRIALLSLYISCEQDHIEPRIIFPQNVIADCDFRPQNNYHLILPEVIELCTEKKFKEARKRVKELYLEQLSWDGIA